MKIFMFWSVYKGQDVANQWRNTITRISPLHHLTLAAHHKLGNEVCIYTYQPLSVASFPDNVEVRNADEFFSTGRAFLAQRIGHSIAHISDLIRLRAAAEERGMIADMDLVPLRKFPEERGFFTSMPAKLTGGFAPKWGKSHPKLIVHDNSWDGKALSSFPVSVDKPLRPYISSLADLVEKSLVRLPKQDSKAWNFVMWSLKRMPMLDKSYKVYDPLYFCPVPAWLPHGKCYSLESPTRMDGKTKLYGHTLPAIDNILENSYAVQHFFESAFKGRGVSKNNFWNYVKEGSLLAREAEHILGEDWQFILDERANRE